MGLGDLFFLTGFLYFSAGHGLPDIAIRAFWSPEAAHHGAGALIDPSTHLHAGDDFGGSIGIHLCSPELLS